MKSVEWQQKILRANLRVTRVRDKDGSERRNKKLPGHRTKYAARLKKSSSTILTASKWRVFVACRFTICHQFIDWRMNNRSKLTFLLFTQESREKF